MGRMEGGGKGALSGRAERFGEMGILVLLLSPSVTPQGVLSDSEISYIRPDQPRAAVLRLLEYMAVLHCQTIFSCV